MVIEIKYDDDDDECATAAADRYISALTSTLLILHSHRPLEHLVCTIGFQLNVRSARTMIGYWHVNVVCLSVRLSVTLCIVTKRYILAAKVSEEVNRKSF